MAHECDGCGEQFDTLTALRLHNCPHPSADNELTVLSDWSHGNEPTHREAAETLLPQLQEEMTKEQRIDFTLDLQSAVIDTITRDLSANLSGEDWHGMGFEEPEDFLDAGQVSSAIGDRAEWYFEDDQTGKSMEVIQVIFEYAENHGLAEHVDE